MPSVDQRVVEMQFDNRKFENGVQTTMSTIEKLKSSLSNIGNSAKTAGEALGKVNNLDFSALQNGIDALNYRFSAAGIAGATFISNITSSLMEVGAKIMSYINAPLAQTISLIKEGGKQRALNIQQAKYQIQGLGFAFEELDDDINHAVNGTRYGYDEAAMAASQLAASGIDFVKSNGEVLDNLSDMGVSLTAISGVASMTNSEYGRIADIFTRVAGNGKLMTMQLQQLSGYGLNIAATMAQQWGITEGEVRDMVSKGQVDFKMFSESMYKAFADAALKADTTFTGVSANIRAAWKKIGMDFWNPIVQNEGEIVKGMGAFKDLINKTIRPAIQEIFIGDWSEFVSKFGKTMEAFFHNESLIKSVDNFIHIFGNAFYLAKDLFSIFNGIFKKYFGYLAPTIDGIEKITEKVRVFTDTLRKYLTFTEKDFGTVSVSDLIGDEDFSLKFEKFSKLIERLKHIFEGFASFLDIIYGAIQGFWRVISPSAFKEAEGFADSALIIFEKIANYITDLAWYLDENDFFYKAFKAVADKLSPIVNTFKDAFNALKTMFDDFSRIIAGPIGASIISFIENFGDTVSTVSDKISPKISVFDAITTAFSWTLQKISDIWAKLKDFFGKIKSGDTGFITTIKDKLVEFFKALDFRKIMSLITGGVLIKAIYSISEFFDKLTNIFKKKNAIDPDRLIKISEAIVILAGALFILSLIDPERLTNAVVAMSIAFAELGAMAVAMSNFLKAVTLWKGTLKDGFSKNANPGVFLLEIAGAILIMAAAIKLLSTVDMEHLATGLIAIEVMMIEVLAFAKKLQETKLDGSVGLGIVLLAAGILILTKSVEKLGQIEPDKLIIGLGAVFALLSELVFFLKHFSKTEGLISAGIAFNLIAVSMLIFQKALSALGGMDMEQLGRGLVGMGIVLFELVAAMNFIPKDTALKAIGVLILANALVILAGALNIIAFMDPEKMAGAIMTLGGALIEITIALNYMKGTIGASAALLIASVAITVLTGALWGLALLNPTQLITSLVALGGALMIFGVAAHLLKGTELTMLALSGSIALIGAGVLTLGIGLQLAAVGITAFAIALAGGAVAIAAGLGTIILGLVGLIPTIAVMLAKGLEIFIVTLAEGADKIADAVLKLVETILSRLVELLPVALELITELFMLVAAALGEFLGMLIELLPQVKELVLTFLQTVIDTLVEGIPMIVGGALMLIEAFLQELSLHLDDIIYYAIEVVVAFINGIAQGLPDVIQAAIDLVLAFINGLADAIRNNYDAVIQALGNLLSALIEAAIGSIGSFIAVGFDLIGGVAEGILDAIDNAITGLVEVLNSLIEKVKEFVSDFFEAGKNLILGLADGLGSAVSDAVGAIGSVCSTLWGKVTDFFSIASPSKKMHWVGEMIDKGLANGLGDFAHVAENAAGDMADDTLDSMLETFGAIQDVVNDNIDLTPSITPVLDTSEIQNGSKVLDGFFGTQRSLALASSTGASFMTNSRSMAEMMDDIMGRSTGSIIDKMNNASDSSLTVEVPLYMNAKEVGHATANIVNDDINRMQRNAMRRAGNR